VDAIWRSKIVGLGIPEETILWRKSALSPLGNLTMESARQMSGPAEDVGKKRRSKA
jgi:hypothetical protein